MIKRFFVFVTLAFLLYMLYPLVTQIEPPEELSNLAYEYVKNGPQELGAQNLVTSVVVTYRGLDTLGEVTVLFIATAGVGFFLRRKGEISQKDRKRNASEILQTGAAVLLPLIFLFGAYIFIHGHLTPGGGFQGGVVIASGVLLLMLANVSLKLNHLILHFLESLSGASYGILGLLGLVLAGGFLDNRFLPLGEFGRVFSAGAIPIIYSLIGLKVGSELTGILENMREA